MCLISTGEAMNIYKCEPPKQSEFGGYQWHVAAPTRGKARSLFLSHMSDFFEPYDWTDPISIRLLEKNVDLPEGVDERFKWARGYPDRYPPEFFPENNPEFS